MKFFAFAILLFGISAEAQSLNLKPPAYWERAPESQRELKPWGKAPRTPDFNDRLRSSAKELEDELTKELIYGKDQEEAVEHKIELKFLDQKGRTRFHYGGLTRVDLIYQVGANEMDLNWKHPTYYKGYFMLNHKPLRNNSNVSLQWDW